MTIFQIKQLTSTECHLACDEQRQVYGGGAGPHNYIAPSEERQEELWQGYSDEDYDIELLDRYKNSSGDYVAFNYGTSNRRNTAPAGVIKL